MMCHGIGERQHQPFAIRGNSTHCLYGGCYQLRYPYHHGRLDGSAALKLSFANHAFSSVRDLTSLLMNFTRLSIRWSKHIGLSGKMDDVLNDTADDK